MIFLAKELPVSAVFCQSELCSINDARMFLLHNNTVLRKTKYLSFEVKWNTQKREEVKTVLHSTLSVLVSESFKKMLNTYKLFVLKFFAVRMCSRSVYSVLLRIAKFF